MIYQHKRSARSYLIRPFLVLVVLAGVFGLVWLRSSIITLEYEIGSLEQQKVRALKEAQSLKAELASLLSIKQVDERKIALAFPDRQRVIYVKRDEAGVPHTASLRGARR